MDSGTEFRFTLRLNISALRGISHIQRLHVWSMLAFAPGGNSKISKCNRS